MRFHEVLNENHDDPDYVPKVGDVVRPRKKSGTSPADLLKGELEQNYMWDKYLQPNVTWTYLETPAGKCVVNIDERGSNLINLHWLIAQQQGAGRAALTIITSLADKYGVTIMLDAVPMKSVGFKPTIEQLVRFYKGFGFKLQRAPKGETYPHMLRKPNIVTEDVATSQYIGDIVRNAVKDYSGSPKYINNGSCWGFACALARVLGPEAKVVNTTGLQGVFPGHSVVLYRGKYYDAESPDGVTDPKELAYSKRIYRSMDHDDHDPRPAIRKWPQTLTPRGLLKFLDPVAARDPVTLNHLKRFNFYVLGRIPMAMINFEDWELEDDRAEASSKHETSPPPIIWDELDETIIDGVSRALAADRGGYDSILAYIGQPEEENPDWVRLRGSED
jgi:hypothetical protein